MEMNLRISHLKLCFTFSGEHPRLGALDVCPFIPVSNATMDDCVECANMFGQRAANELGIPGRK